MRLELLGTSFASRYLSESNEKQANSGSFLTYLNNALQSVDQLQKEASAGAQQMALGDEEYLHNTVLAYEKASLALQLTLEIRNRIVEAFQEIMRIQM
ncbi:MAG TPA: flagellar hook-basal body complex protein FliE [Syntrophomonadaceae bacterium]|nr:flagellar hook-basal body complex protein FliE [Syntrophomonadaceae bacterium]HQA08460.1 flagellar hook-basal body complex protein FliE [Syntrophomonadaceae bacterium]HQE23500.1 flagellar hook-basal body complex protein FliE [Syntrophomonadaceae bacterium]